MASKLSKHELSLLSIARDAKKRYHRREDFKSWLRGFMRPARGSDALKSELKVLLEEE